MSQCGACGFLRWLVVAAGVTVATNGLADTRAASVTELEHQAFAVTRGGAMRTLHNNDPVFETEKIVTGKDSSLVLAFTDETRLTLGPGTAITVDSYQYRQRDAGAEPPVREQAFATSILSGVVRAVTGLLAKRRPHDVKFRAVVATIGIRGTHFAAEVDGERATVILLAPDDPDQANAIEVSNAYGSVAIDQPGFGTEIPDARSPPSPPRKMKSTQTMNRILRSVHTTGRVRIPRSPMR